MAFSWPRFGQILRVLALEQSSESRILGPKTSRDFAGKKALSSQRALSFTVKGASQGSLWLDPEKKKFPPLKLPTDTIPTPPPPPSPGRHRPPPPCEAPFPLTKGPFTMKIRSHPGKPNQRKASSCIFYGGIPEQKFDMWIVLVFPRKTTRIHKSGRNSWTFRFGPFKHVNIKKHPENSPVRIPPWNSLCGDSSPGKWREEEPPPYQDWGLSNLYFEGPFNSLFEGAWTVKCKPWTERLATKGLSRQASRAAWKRRINRELEAKIAHKPWIREGLSREVQTVN